jgi:hypothetical protein
MSELTREQNLLNTLMYDNNLTEKDYEEIRLYFIDKIFSYKDSSIFDTLVDWNINYKEFVRLRINLMDKPTITDNLVYILEVIDKLDYKHRI